MKKKTKVSKKKLDSLLLVLLLTAVLLIMSTYAWFTANRTVSIGNLDVRIEKFQLMLKIGKQYLN